jgi:excisionase family DNA binding protein
MEHNDREVFMPLASNNERTATVGVTRPPERLARPFQGSERLMTLLEVSQLLGVPVATLYRWRHRGEGPTGYRIGRHVRYRRAAVEAWIEAQADQRPDLVVRSPRKRATGRSRHKRRPLAVVPGDPDDMHPFTMGASTACCGDAHRHGGLGDSAVRTNKCIPVSQVGDPAGWQQ